MSQPNNVRNPRKRNAQQMMFQRALFALNKNDAKPYRCPAPKRARIVLDESKDSNDSNDSNTNRSHSKRNRVHSFSKPPPSSPSRNFLHDLRRNTHQYRSKSMRHTPSHRMSSNNNIDYSLIEECRMKKLWTDLNGDNEYIISSLKFCRDTSFFITSNSIAHKISFVIRVLLFQYLSFSDNKSIKILDALACIGGNSYSFAKTFNARNHDIYCNELDDERCNALKHNMNVLSHYNLLFFKSRFHFYNMDFLDLHYCLGSAVCDEMDVVFLDPEWNNGDDYKQTNRGEIHLFDIGGLHLHCVIDNIIMKWYKNVNIIAIKLAKNYDESFIHRKLQKCKLIENKVFRVGQISFHNQKLIVIVRQNNKNKKTFEEIFDSIPKMANKNLKQNSRDAINVKILS